MRALIDHKNSIISSQDYDAWGYLLHGREYHSDGSVYKFTGKERDSESKYDYFGARYYDARIGRWGQVEPLYFKYLSLTPYSYSANNPLVFIDIDGKDIIIKGDDAKKVVKELRNSTSLKFKFDKKTGKLTISGKAKTKMEELLLKASQSEDIIINLTTTRQNSPKYWVVGAFYGSTIENNKVIASQSFNIKFARVWEEAGGSEVGLSAAHEIVEAFIGGVFFPGEQIKSSDEPNYGWSHFMTVLVEQAEGNIQYYPDKFYDPAYDLYYYRSEDKKSYFPIK